MIFLLNRRRSPFSNMHSVHSGLDNTLLRSVSHMRMKALAHLFGLTTFRTSLLRSLYSVLFRLSLLSASRFPNFHSVARLSNVVGSNSERSLAVRTNLCTTLLLLLLFNSKARFRYNQFYFRQPTSVSQWEKLILIGRVK